MVQLTGLLRNTYGRNITGIVISFAAVFALLAVVQALAARRRIGPEAARKIVHIGVAHWWLIAMLFIDDPWFAGVGPLFFLLFNAVALRINLFSALEVPAERRSLGTIYYPLSLLVLVFLTFTGLFPVYTGALGVLIMGWGDGLAAIVGTRARTGRYAFASTAVANGHAERSPRKESRSVAGSATMLTASFVVGLLVISILGPATGAATLIGRAAATALFATVIEAVTPFGLDNLTVPILTVLFYNLVIV